MKYIIGIDEGTTSARAVLFNIETNKIEKLSRGKFTQFFPNEGWVEHNAEEIYNVVFKALKEVSAGLNKMDIYSIGITNQRETVVAFSKATGKPLAKAICWQDRRTADFCKKLKESKFAKAIKEKTGLMPDSYFSASKMKWLLDNNQDVKKALKNNDLLFGTIESYLVYRLTNGAKHITDVTNASRTQLMNINSLTWDSDLLKLFGIPQSTLPTIVDNSGNFGLAKIGKLVIPICGLCGDQQSSLFGQGCHYAGGLKNTYGTGSFLLLNTGSKPVYSQDLLSTIAYKINNKICYALEGSVYDCGTAVDWAVKDLGLYSSPQELDKMAGSLGDNCGVYFVPAFSGLGCPNWDMDAFGMICGLTRATVKPQIARAVLEGIAYQVYDVVTVLENVTHKKIKTIRADGGVTNNNFLMQFQADLLNANIKLSNSESTVLGAIFLAGLASGAYNSLEEIETKVETLKEFSPQESNKQVIKKALAGWRDAIKKCTYHN